MTLRLERLKVLRGMIVTADTHMTYADNPAGFCLDVLGDFLWSKQTEIMEAIRDHRRVAVRSCHSAGKSFIAGRAAAWWLATHEPGTAFVVSTAPTFRQVRAILWREIGRAHRAGDLLGRVTQTEWWAGDEIIGFGTKPADWNPDAFQGIHAPFVLVVIDEACGVPTSIFEAAETLASNVGSKVLVIGNPDDPTSEFATVSEPGSGWETIRIDGLETPNFTDEVVPDEVGAVLLDPGWVDDRRNKWSGSGTKPSDPILDGDGPLWVSKVRGEFPEESEETLITAGWVREAIDRDLEPGEDDPSTLGVDVARYGSDESVIIHRRGPWARLHWTAGKSAVTTVTGQVHAAMRDLGCSVANVDVVGVGGGVVDQLIEDGVTVAGLNAGGAPRDRERFVNARGEWFWELRERFREGRIDIEPDDDLAGQLVSMRWWVDSRGRVVVEPKDQMLKRGVPSPDRADALMLAFASHGQILEGSLGV